ncbi:MAG: methylated-DNA--[protein]-cysteine S-methyltransferase [Gammaproteobacteria bacterium]|nr:methylated-DNA--[protein]-cysteine S-methyltransferase [Gammaproteobacteria bacterium]MYD77327.1 methylated-DNA--[protein]-cysteine S-methyltransferase [Gammaproteobacteria bacterium]MYJ51126.1 methylated-DNA--[protein]-cysteine S-methyltransferase [Gammaproteobacteria bacterium]
MKRLDCAICPGPLGDIRVVFDDGVLVLLDFDENSERIEKLLGKRYGSHSLQPVSCSSRIRESLEKYFDGDFKALDRIEMDPGGTAFQRTVWDALGRIPAGESRSYTELAGEIGMPKAARAVGNANARNPISIAIPCHRVIGRNGRLSGYAGGVSRQQWLLQHEGAIR